MPAPPIENPTPYTCAHCGAGFTRRAEFCPRCGARLEWKPAKSAGWIVGSLALGLGTLIFGGIGACSTWVSGSVIFTGDGDHISAAILMFALPLLFFGGVGAWLCGRALLRRFRE